MSKKFFAFLSLAFVLTALPMTGFALTVRQGDNVVVTGNVEGNFFGAGNLIIIEGNINGDVFVAGNNISVKGTVNGDVFAAGSSVDVSGNIKGNLRAAASNINIMGRIDRNVLAGSASLIISERASVGGHVTYGGASFVVQGPVLGQIDAAVQNMTINSSVGGDVTLLMDNKENQSRLILAEKAALYGNLNYKAVSEAEINPNAKIFGETNYTPLSLASLKADKVKQSIQEFTWVAKSFGFLSLFLAGLILIYLIPKITDRIYLKIKEKPWSNIGIGLLAIIVTPVVGIMLLFTVVSIPLVLTAFALFTIAIYFAKAMVAVALGRWMAERFNWNWHKALMLLVGTAIFTIAGLIPLIGWLAAFAAVLWAFGALLRVGLEIVKEWR